MAAHVPENEAAESPRRARRVDAWKVGLAVALLLSVGTNFLLFAVLHQQFPVVKASPASAPDEPSLDVEKIGDSLWIAAQEYRRKGSAAPSGEVVAWVVNRGTRTFHDVAVTCAMSLWDGEDCNWKPLAHAEVKPVGGGRLGPKQRVKCRLSFSAAHAAKFATAHDLAALSLMATAVDQNGSHVTSVGAAPYSVEKDGQVIPEPPR